MSLDLTNIPAIMRSKGWDKGAALMDRWFAGPALATPQVQSPDTSTITMQWALGYSRARDTYNKLIRERVWANPAAQGEIKKLLQRKNKLTNTAQRFGQLSGAANVLDADYINYRGIGSGYSGVYSGASGDTYYGLYYYGASYYGGGMDDMMAGLGNFVFRVLVSGSVAPSGSGHDVTIDRIGVYLRDSYSFEGDQHLGFWDDSDNSVSAINFLSGTRVTNKSFREWRTANGKGGDYLIYSDIKQVPLARPDQFHLV
ncbi:MAG: DUF6402 family protein [Planctomycetota bacterium]